MSDELVTVLGVGRYSFNDDKSGRLVEGTTVHYYSHNDEKQSDLLGYKPAKATLPLDHYEKYQGKSFPFDATIDFSLVIKSGKPAVKVNGFNEVK